MNKLWKRMLSFLLIFCIVLSYGSNLVYGAEKDKAQKTPVMNVMERYEKYRNGEYNYKYLTERNRYTYCAWTDSVYEMTTCEEVTWDNSSDKKFMEKLKKLSKDLSEQVFSQLTKAFTWAGHVLTDTKLNKEAYINYLSRIIAMHEKGFLETAASQAEYTATVNVGSEVKKIFNTALGAVKMAAGDEKGDIVKNLKLKLKDLMNEEQRKKIEKAYEVFDKHYKRMKKAMSLEKALTTEIKNVAEAQAIGNYLSLYEERIAFLEVLRDEAEPNSELYEAAQVMIEASDMRLMGLIMVNPEERANNFMKLSSYGEKSFSEFTDEMMQYVTMTASSWMAKYSEKMAADFLTGMKNLNTSVSLVTAGFQIGGALGKIFLGDQYEMAREMLIMDEMGSILTNEVLKGDQRFLKLKKEELEKGYQNLVKHVAVAESLCYIHLRGEYCVTEYTKKVNDANSEAGLDMVYERDAVELNKAYQNLAAIFPEPKNVENNGGQVVGYQGNVYYWKYNGNSFEPEGLFASYNYNTEAENDLICRDEDGKETVLLTAKGNGPIFISGDRIYLMEDNTNLFSVNMGGNDRENHGNMEVWAAAEQAGTLLVKKDDGEGDYICLLQPDHELKIVHSIEGKYVEMTQLAVIDGYCFFSSYDVTADSPGFIIYRISLDGSEVKTMASVTANDKYAYGLNACQLIKAGENLYYSYGYYAGSGGFFQAGGINCMDMNGENDQICVSYGELAAEDFLVEERDGETRLYYIGGDEITGSYIGFWDDYYYDSSYVKIRKEGEKNWKTTQRNLNISRLGSFICAGGRILRMNPERMEYETLIPETAGFGFIDQPGQYEIDSNFPLISQLDVIGEDVYFTVDWNEATGRNMGWRPGYRRQRSAFYTIKIGEEEAKELYSY